MAVQRRPRNACKCSELLEKWVFFLLGMSLPDLAPEGNIMLTWGGHCLCFKAIRYTAILDYRTEEYRTKAVSASPHKMYGNIKDWCGIVSQHLYRIIKGGTVMNGHIHSFFHWTIIEHLALRPAPLQALKIWWWAVQQTIHRFMIQHSGEACKESKAAHKDSGRGVVLYY